MWIRKVERIKCIRLFNVNDAVTTISAWSLKYQLIDAVGSSVNIVTDLIVRYRNWVSIQPTVRARPTDVSQTKGGSLRMPFCCVSIEKKSWFLSWTAIITRPLLFCIWDFPGSEVSQTAQPSPPRPLFHLLQQFRWSNRVSRRMHNNFPTYPRCFAEASLPFCAYPRISIAWRHARRYIMTS